MGYKVNWNPKSKVVVMTKGSETIEVYVGTTRYKINGIEKRSIVTNNIVNGTTYVGNEILDLLKK
ncbi:stalk domain-containing protein [Proteocatella sphenisci]|uniref:stalk domain-containing protein n=1 Tax=Proteocatella sphenisci TaxID=181070 RepID=UPI0038CD3FAE